MESIGGVNDVIVESLKTSKYLSLKITIKKEVNTIHRGTRNNKSIEVSVNRVVRDSKRKR